jgi:hypothetical protein
MILIQGDGVFTGIQALCIQCDFEFERGQHLRTELTFRSGREEINVDLVSFNRLNAATDCRAGIWIVSLDKQGNSFWPLLNLDAAAPGNAVTPFW